MFSTDVIAFVRLAEESNAKETFTSAVQTFKFGHLCLSNHKFEVTSDEVARIYRLTFCPYLLSGLLV